MATKNFTEEQLKENFELLMKLYDPSRVPEKDKQLFEEKYAELVHAFNIVIEYKRNIH